MKNRSVMASHWAFVIVILPWLIELVDTDWMSTVDSALELLLVRFQWLSTDAELWIVSSNQSTDTGPLCTVHI